MAISRAVKKHFGMESFEVLALTIVLKHGMPPAKPRRDATWEQHVISEHGKWREQAHATLYALAKTDNPNQWQLHMHLIERVIEWATKNKSLST